MYEASSGVFDFSRFTPKYIVIAAKMNNLQYVQYFNLKKKYMSYSINIFFLKIYVIKPKLLENYLNWVIPNTGVEMILKFICSGKTVFLVIVLKGDIWAGWDKLGTCK